MSDLGGARSMQHERLASALPASATWFTVADQRTVDELVKRVDSLERAVIYVAQLVTAGGGPKTHAAVQKAVADLLSGSVMLPNERGEETPVGEGKVSPKCPSTTTERGSSVGDD